MLFMLLLTGCSIGGSQVGGPSQGETNQESDGEGTSEEGETTEIGSLTEKLTYDSSLSGTVTFWTWTPDIYEQIIVEFNKDYPNVEVELVGLEFGDLHDTLQTTLAAGEGAPDAVQVEQNQFARYSTGDLVEDLLQPPYNASRYQDGTSEYNWERWKSVDGERLLGMPWDVTPGVFYYREDLYEQVGLPSEPEALGEFLKDPENVITAAQTLASSGMYMFEWRDSPAVQYGDAIGYFDSEYNWLRNDEKKWQNY